MSGQFEQKNSIFLKMGESLGDIWICRHKLFWLSFFSAFLLYAVNLIKPIASLDFLISSYVIAVFSVLIYRFFLERDVKSSVFSGYFDTFRSFFVWLWHVTSGIFLILSFAIISMSLDFLTDNLVTGIVSIVAALLSFYIALRLVFVSLGLAMGQGFSSFKNSWHATKGRGLSLFAIVIPIAVIFYGVSIVNDVAAYTFKFLNHFLPGVLQHVSYVVELAFNVVSALVGWVWTLFFISKMWTGWSGKDSH